MQCRYCLLQEFSYNKCARLFYLGQYRVELSGYSWVTSFYFLSGIHSGVETRKYQIKYFFLSLKIVNCLCRIFFSLYTAYRVGIGIWKAEISSKTDARDVEFLNAIFGILRQIFAKKIPPAIVRICAAAGREFWRARVDYAFSTRPALMAFVQTHKRFTEPSSARTRTLWTLGLKVRLFCLTSCKPMPPLFLLWPLWIILRPLTGRFPVIAHTLDMVLFLVWWIVVFKSLATRGGF